MKSNQKITVQTRTNAHGKHGNSSATTAVAIEKKLLEIKRISRTGEMNELNMVLWRHLK